MPPDSLDSRRVEKGRRADNSTSDAGCGPSDFLDPAATNISRRDSCSGGNDGQTSSNAGNSSTTITSSATIITTSTTTTSTASTVTVTTTQDTTTTSISVISPTTVQQSIQSTVNSQVIKSTESSDSETEVTGRLIAATSSLSSSPLFTSSGSSFSSFSSSTTQNPVSTSLTPSSFGTPSPGTSALAFGVSTDLPQSTTSSASDTNSTNPPSSSSSPPIAAIAGGIAGAIVLWLCLAFYCYCRRRKRRYERTGSQEFLSPRGHVSRPSDTSFFTPYLRQITPTPRPKIVIQTTELPNNDTLVPNPNANPLSAITPGSDIGVYTDTVLLPSPATEIAASSPEPSEPDSDAYYTSEMDPESRGQAV